MDVRVRSFISSRCGRTNVQYREQGYGRLPRVEWNRKKGTDRDKGETDWVLSVCREREKARRRALRLIVL